MSSEPVEPDDSTRNEEDTRNEEGGGIGGEEQDSGLARRRRWVVAVAVAAAVLGAAGVGASMVIKSPAQAAAEARAPKEDVLTAVVERRVLVSSVITRGQVRAGQTVNVSPQVSGGGEGATGAVITKLPVKAQDVLSSGRLLMEVSGRPVFVLRGKVPVYRDLRPGSEGDDVGQLQKALRDLGHPTAPDADGTFGVGTKTALSSFYASIGYDPLPAQDDDGEGVGAAAEAVRSAERALEDAKDSGPAAKGDGGAPGDPRKAVERAEEDLAGARADYAEVQAKSGPMLPAGETVFLESFPARVSAVQGVVGGKVSGTVMTLSSGRLAVRAYVPEYQKGLLRAGQHVEIYSEATGVSARAEVTRVADTQTAPDRSDAEPGAGGGEGDGTPAAGPVGYLVQITPDKALDAQLSGQDVRLTIEAASTGRRALVVPITAITAGADGRTVVTVVTGSGDQKRVEVRPGTSGDGYVSVEPVARAALRAGDRVVTGVRK
ncbi:peptidoglycan-binding domain-containing protein [Streptomyces sp. NPDC049967]|uniref:peptidoglycan-binding domain-containing protein n=1 Tax=Streptomyces sp. NPDC049967 TaxID=3155658 RepID=UPI003437DAA5